MGAFTVVPSCLMFVLLCFLDLFPVMHVSLFSSVCIPGPLLIWERAADSIYHLSHLFTDVISCSDFFPLVYCGRSLGSDLSVPDRCLFQLFVSSKKLAEFACCMPFRKLVKILRPKMHNFSSTIRIKLEYRDI